MHDGGEELLWFDALRVAARSREHALTPGVVNLGHSVATSFATRAAGNGDGRDAFAGRARRSGAAARAGARVSAGVAVSPPVTAYERLASRRK